MFRNDKGITLTEIVVVIGITGLIIESLFLFINQGYKSWRTARDQATAQENARSALDKIVEEIREIQPSGPGGASIDSAENNSFIFYSNIDIDSDIERVRYFLEGTDFKKGVIEPVTNVNTQEITYPTANETKYLKAHYVRNIDLFSYYDKDNQQIGNDQKSNITEVHIKIVVDYDTNQPPGAITLETDANLRNKSLL